MRDRRELGISDGTAIKEMLDVWVLCMSICLALLQVTKLQYSVEFTAASTPLVLTASSDVLSQLSSDTSYALVIWVKWAIPPIATSVVPQTKNSASARMSVTQGTDGRWTASADSTSGLVNINSPVLSTSVWTHIGVSVCSGAGLTLYITQWHSATTSYSVSALAFHSLDPVLTTLSLGTGVVGELLDCRMATSCVSSIVSESTCSPLCHSGCFGPGDKSCSDFLQLTDETIPWTVSASYKAWTRDDPHLQSRSFTSTTYSYTGWYYQTSYSVGWTSMFRSRDIAGDCCNIGQRVLTILQNGSSAYMHITMDLNTGGNYHNNVNFPRSGGQPTFLNKWLFLSVSANPLLVSYCFAVYPDIEASCTIFTRASGANLQWGLFSTSELSIGDTMYAGPIGKIGDQRYYPI